MPAACAPRLNSRPCWPRAEPQPRDGMASPQHRARKRFGQNFLHDPHVIARIVDAIDPRAGDTIVEIGPGQAALTRRLIERTGHIVALEIDRDLAASLRNEFPRRAAVSDRRRRARLRLVRDQRTAADRRQPAVQHLLAAAVRADADRRSRARPALHAAEGSGRPHGGVARQPHLWSAVGHAAVALSADQTASTSHPARSGPRRR